MLDIAFAFDLTGSMYPAIAETRRRVSEACDKLFNSIEGIRITVYGFGNHADRNPIVRGINAFCGESDKDKLINFVKDVPAYSGGCHYYGGCPAVYENVMQDCQNLDWRNDAKKVLVLIGDENPSHPKEGSRHGRKDVDWKVELKNLVKNGVSVYGVHCLGSKHSLDFYKTVARDSDGIQVDLKQFNEIVDLLMAICYKQKGEEALDDFEKEIVFKNKMTRSLAQAFAILTGKSVSDIATFKNYDDELKPVDPSRFQVLNVDNDVDIKTFVTQSGAKFKIGRGFYQFSKTETVQEKKEVVLVDEKSGDMWTGDKAREMIGVPPGTRGRVKPNLSGYKIFIQSTSNNRKLKGNTQFLYEVEKV